MMANQSYSDNVTGSCVEEVARYAAMDLVAPAVQILLMVVVCAGNGLVFVVFWRQPQFHLRSLSHYFILQLAIADFTVGLSMPFHVAIYFHRHILHNSTVCVLRYATLMFSGSASVTALLAMSYDRYLAIVRPLDHYSCSLTWRKAVITAALIWIPPFIVAFLLPMLWHNGWSSGCPLDCDMVVVLKREYFVYVMFPAFPLVAACLVYLYARVLVVARRHVRRLSVQDAAASTARAKSNRRRRDLAMFKTCLIVISVFCCCWLPYCIIIVLQVLGDWKGNSKAHKFIRIVAVLIAVLNSALNPIIYAFRLRGFRAEIRHMFTKKTCKAKKFTETDSSVLENRLEMENCEL